MPEAPIDPCILNAWHAVGAVDELPRGLIRRTRMLGTPIALTRPEAGAASVWIDDETPSAGPSRARSELPVIERYGYVWTSLGRPERDLFPLPEFAEPDRRNLNAASIGVHVSAPRVIENFLDMGHLPFVHQGILGDEPHTEVRDYNVEVSAERDEILATKCFAFQPKAAASASGSADIEYVFRVPHPYCSVLYKSSAGDNRRMDVIAIFAQPLDEEHVCAHMLLSMVDHQSADAGLKGFQQMIFGQDKPILENQVPKRLPLDPRAEMPVRADASSIAYRLWLKKKGVTYGTLS
jgi:phenylpropionate dioxygenase-like ring-hydroxylating dioxygenase large terminal subunit